MLSLALPIRLRLLRRFKAVPRFDVARDFVTCGFVMCGFVICDFVMLDLDTRDLYFLGIR